MKRSASTAGVQSGFTLTSLRSAPPAAPQSYGRQVEHHVLKKRRSGFTLIELLLVIAIIAIVAGVVIAAVSPRRNITGARDAERRHMEKQLSQALYARLIDEWKLPEETPEGQANAKPICRQTVPDAACGGAGGVSLSSLPPTYISAIPVDPVMPENSNCTGYMVYQEVGRPRVYAANAGKLPGDNPDGMCGVGAGAGGGNSSHTTVTTDASTAVALAIGNDGLPVVAYQDNTDHDVMVLHCGTNDCSSGNTITQLPDPDPMSNSMAMTIGNDGLPILAYYNPTMGEQDLMITHCGNAACSAGNATTQVSDPNVQGMVGRGGIAIGADGLPVVVHTDGTVTDLMVLHCGNVSCTSGNTHTQIASGENDGRLPSVVIAGGFPLIAHKDETIGTMEGKVAITRCTNVTCSSSSTTRFTPSAGAVHGVEHLIIGSDGLPLIVTRLASVTDLLIIHCNDLTCSSFSEQQVPDSGLAGWNATIAVGSDSLPIIAYLDEGPGAKSQKYDLDIVHCNNAACSSFTTHTFNAGSNWWGYGAFIARGSDGLPVIAHVNLLTHELMVTHCGNADCSAPES